MKYNFRFNLLFFVLLISIFSCNNAKNAGEFSNESKKETIRVFHAGSMSVPMKEIAASFKSSHQNVEILLESAGSRTCARKITDLKKECDLMVSADYTVIDNLLIPDFAKWNIKFASNEMVIAFTEKSKRNTEINADNWYEILLDKNVAFGRSEPNSDPCGYRSVLTVKLAEKYYNNEQIIKLLDKDVNYIRPKEVDLLGLLDINAIDYIFIYLSVAKQHKLNYIILPDQINLKNPEFTDLYNSVTVKISGKKPNKFITKTGEPMIYGLTIPDNSQNQKLALEFVEFFLSSKNGMAIIEKDGQESVIPSVSDSYSFIPDRLKKFAKPQ